MGEDGGGPAHSPVPTASPRAAFSWPVRPCAWVSGVGGSVGCSGVFTRGAGGWPDASSSAEQASWSRRCRCVVGVLCDNVPVSRWLGGARCSSQFLPRAFETLPLNSALDSPKDCAQRRKMCPRFQEEAVTAKNLYAIDVLKLLPVSEAGNQCLLIAVDPVTK